MKLFFTSVAGFFRVLFTLILSPVLRGWYNRWGATDEEASATLPGDDLVPTSRLTATHAITIGAPPARVWPWIAQLGQGRGGMYSYEGLENLVGCQITNVDHILPEHQHPAPGDLIRMGPEGFPAFVVHTVIPGELLLLVGADPKTGEAPPLPATASGATWAFILRPEGDKTRLVTRSRNVHPDKEKVIWRITEPISFVMESKMLREIRRLVEKEAAR